MPEKHTDPESDTMWDEFENTAPAKQSLREYMNSGRVYRTITEPLWANFVEVAREQWYADPTHTDAQNTAFEAALKRRYPEAAEKA